MKTLLATTAAVLLAVPVLAAAPASAAGSDVRRSGSCSGRTDWKIKAGPDDGRIEVEAEIDGNRAGQTWRWKLRHDGDALDSRDAFTFRATNRATGETCVARVTL
ncbi:MULTISPECIES: hypothetical protein [unclassified Nocardioides]|uniref:hypothetical protein n=1 Tax=unclassified Nocardioides TaxID=2615069 RepID=UPI0000EB6397|nr:MULTISPECIES: hypothetical protein [unclassified Nocardioides]ABL83298.1 hypothetical protein Noca_3798 [Nocardioides sp. JS614]